MKNLWEEVKKFQNKKILVIGDIGLDEYVNGSVKRISPEAPVPVVEVNKEELRLGLATNVAQNIRSLGGEPLLISVIGKDFAGDQLRTLLRSVGVSDADLVMDSTRPTTRKLRVMSEHHHVVRVDYETKKFLNLEVENQIIQKTESLIAEVQCVVLQDYAKGLFSEKGIQKIIQIAKEHNKKIVVDPHRATPIHYYKGADLMTPNAEEAILLSGYQTDDLRGVSESFEEIGQVLMEQIGSHQMIVTRGKDGMSIFENNKNERVPTFARDVFDVTGAGDTVIAAIALAWSSGVSLKNSALLANHAAGVVVGKIGCATCDLNELQKSIENESLL